MNMPFQPPAVMPQSPAQQLQAMPADPPKPVTHDLVIATTKKLQRARVMGVPPEEFGIERGARTIKDCNYCYHDVTNKTEAQLIAEGFDKDQIMQLGDYTGNTDLETVQRDTVQEHVAGMSSSGNKAARLVKLTEHYVRMDYESTGRPCLYMVITGGDQGEILRKGGKEVIEPIDAIPFAACTPIPMTHRFFGRSIADLVMPAQREKTALKRGALDNIYLRNNPRVEVAEQNAGPNTLDDLLVSRPGGVVRTKTTGGLNWQVVPDVSTSAYPMMQYIDAELASRTGLTKQSQGIDADALQNQSATAVAKVFDASQMRVKLIARLLAEGVRDMFALLHGTIRSHGQQKQTVRLRNAWVNVDPRGWKTRDDMTINVGLGSGGKAQQFAQTMAIGNVQKELLAGGKGHLVGDKQLYNTAAELTKIMGHKNPDKFFCDPEAKDPKTQQLLFPPQAPPPDPKLMQIQAQAENDKQELALKAELDKQKAQHAAQLAELEANIDAKLALVNAHLKAVESQNKAAIAQQQHHAKVAETVVGIAATAAAHDQKMEHADAMHQAKIEAAKAKPEKSDG